MPDYNASYYHNELVRWKNALELQEKQIQEFQQKLEAVIHQNTIPGLALHAENFLNKFMLLESEMYSLEGDIDRQQLNLIKNNTAVEDSPVAAPITLKQNSLRNKMKTLDGDIDIMKSNCISFLSGTSRQ